MIYKNNNTYLIIGSDGLDPIFGDLNDILVVGGEMAIFSLSLRKVLTLMLIIIHT